ncbi:hypothetical protein JHK86_040068 [Glycine max]|nr:hypothetical protein JHK86_040068 [Glycine max]
MSLSIVQARLVGPVHFSVGSSAALRAPDSYFVEKEGLYSKEGYLGSRFEGCWIRDVISTAKDSFFRGVSRNINCGRQLLPWNLTEDVFRGLLETNGPNVMIIDSCLESECVFMLAYLAETHFIYVKKDKAEKKKAEKAKDDKGKKHDEVEEKWVPPPSFIKPSAAKRAHPSHSHQQDVAATRQRVELVPIATPSSIKSHPPFFL